MALRRAARASIGRNRATASEPRRFLLQQHCPHKVKQSTLAKHSRIPRPTRLLPAQGRCQRTARDDAGTSLKIVDPSESHKVHPTPCGFGNGAHVLIHRRRVGRVTGELGHARAIAARIPSERPWTSIHAPSSVISSSRWTSACTNRAKDEMFVLDAAAVAALAAKPHWRRFRRRLCRSCHNYAAPFRAALRRTLAGGVARYCSPGVARPRIGRNTRRW